MPDPAIETWLPPDELDRVAYSEYWNDESAERGKAFDVSEGDFARMEEHLRQSGLRDDLLACLAQLDRRHSWRPHGTGVDLAAGNLWAVPTLAARDVERLYCVEISRHRLLDLGRRVVERYGVPPERLVLALGSFYELQLPDRSQDFTFLSQALHHADHPDELLGEIRRVLKPGAFAIVIGEHVIGARERLRYAAKTGAALALPKRAQNRLFKRPLAAPRLRPLGEEIFPHDEMMGDHYYLGWEYRRMFRDAGFDAHRVRRRGSGFQGFILRARLD